MKKLLCFTLTAVLAAALAAPAFADDTKTLDGSKLSDTTEVKFSVQPTYTVTIPATVELGKETAQDGTVTYEKNLTLTASNVRLNEGKSLQILLGSDFQLEIKDKPNFEKLSYTVTADGKTVTSTDNLCATFVTSTADQTVTLHRENLYLPYEPDQRRRTALDFFFQAANAVQGQCHCYRVRPESEGASLPHGYEN